MFDALLQFVAQSDNGGEYCFTPKPTNDHDGEVMWENNYQAGLVFINRPGKINSFTRCLPEASRGLPSHF
jgi:hypothetical protein